MDCQYYGRNFEQVYFCSMTQRNIGDKILLPPSAFPLLMTLNLSRPLLFELYNHSSGRLSHCGVLEFTAGEGFMCLPQWMMQNLRLKEGERAQIRSVSNLAKGTYVKLRAHTSGFLELSNPRAVLESTLMRSFSCLTVGDTVMIVHDKEKYCLDVLEAEPSSAIDIIDTNCKVELQSTCKESEGRQKSGKRFYQNEQNQKFTPFTGVARRLDGLVKIVSPEIKPINSGKLVFGSSLAMQEASRVKSLTRTGKIVFDAREVESREAPKKKFKVDDEKEKKAEEKFRPFTGTPYKVSGSKKAQRSPPGAGPMARAQATNPTVNGPRTYNMN
ncbi:hypothetical protein Tsubulata_024390 [Turnera subulata]|uniref:Uncharacterized protein n=1 Tax=Turnera subulata TaxID=218843 RepID=A0A9Q0J1E7_9ROSI|nr:hypothetical protein Tsubulata_024390 [Turnera subulata]